MRKNKTKILWLPDWSNWIKCTLKKVKYSAEDALWILSIFEYTCKMGNWIIHLGLSVKVTDMFATHQYMHII